MNAIICPCCGREIMAGEGKVPGKTQKERLALVLSDFKPHSTFELVRKVYGVNVATVARLASRIDELRNEGMEIRSMRSKKQPNKWWYCAVKNSDNTNMLKSIYFYASMDKIDIDMLKYDCSAGAYE